MSIEQILEAMTAAPDAAPEMVEVDRATIAAVLPGLEEREPQGADVLYLRRVLAEPKIELWAVHSVGPGEWYPCLDKEDAERSAQELRDLLKGMATGFEPIINVIPSPWTPAEHFEVMAREWKDNYTEQEKTTNALRKERDELRAELDQIQFQQLRKPLILPR